MIWLLIVLILCYFARVTVGIHGDRSSIWSGTVHVTTVRV